MKPWVTTGIKNSIQIRNKLFKNYINKEVIAVKNVMHVKQSMQIGSQHG